MKKINGRSLNPGRASGNAVVFQTPFSFIGDMSPETGEVTMAGSPLFGQCLKGKILVFPTGRGGTIAPFILYRAVKAGVGPAAILCDHADMLTLECALAAGIPIADSFDGGITAWVKTGDMVELDGATCVVADQTGTTT